jgi:hypothetical protein
VKVQVKKIRILIQKGFHPIELSKNRDEHS